MSILKQMLKYLIWTALALLMGIGYMRILIGSIGEPFTGILHLLDVLYYFTLFYVGLIIGLIIALLYILMDVFYLKRKLKNNLQSTLIRFGFLLIIAVVVGVTHYMLEKVIDVI